MFQNRLGWLVVGRKFTIFVLFYFVFEGKFQIQAHPPPPGGGLYSEGRFNGGYFALRFYGAYIWRGLFLVILRYLKAIKFMTKSVKLNLYSELILISQS